MPGFGSFNVDGPKSRSSPKRAQDQGVSAKAASNQPTELRAASMTWRVDLDDGGYEPCLEVDDALARRGQALKFHKPTGYLTLLKKTLNILD